MNYDLYFFFFENKKHNLKQWLNILVIGNSNKIIYLDKNAAKPPGNKYKVFHTIHQTLQLNNVLLLFQSLRLFVIILPNYHEIYK